MLAAVLRPDPAWPTRLDWSSVAVAGPDPADSLLGGPMLATPPKECVRRWNLFGWRFGKRIHRWSAWRDTYLIGSRGVAPYQLRKCLDCNIADSRYTY